MTVWTVHESDGMGVTGVFRTHAKAVQWLHSRHYKQCQCSRRSDCDYRSDDAYHTSSGHTAVIEKWDI